MKRLGILCAVGLTFGLGAVHIYRLEHRLGELEHVPRVDPEAITDLEGELIRVKQELGESRGTIQEASTVKAEATRLASRLEHLESQLVTTTQNLERHGAELRGWRTEFDVSAIDKRISDLQTGVEGRWEGIEERVLGNGHHLDEIARDLKRDKQLMWRELVGPTVQLAGDTTVGSGVLLKSVPNAEQEGAFTTWLITSWHVVRDIQAGLENVDVPVPVTIYSEEGTTTQETAQLIEFDPVIDAALLKLNSTEAIACGAVLASRERLDALRIFEPIYAVGCPLGNDPIPTYGEVASTEHIVDGDRYWMISAPTYVGNSGGGIFDAKDHTLLGIFSKIYTHGSLRPTVVPHMGLVTPLETIYDWLGNVGYGHLEPKASPEEPKVATRR